MAVASLQELCLPPCISQMETLDKKDPRISIIARICEEIILQIHPERTLQEEGGYIKAYLNLTKLAKQWPQFKNYSLAATLSHRAFHQLKSSEIWAMRSGRISSDIIRQIEGLQDPFKFFAVWINAPASISHPGLSAKEVRLSRLVTLDYWSGIGPLVDLGANVHCELAPSSSNPNRTLLHYSIRLWKFGPTTKALIEAGADVNKRDHTGLSPLELIAEQAPLATRPGFEMQEALHFFIQRGADVSISGKKVIEKIRKNQVLCPERYAKIKESCRLHSIEVIKKALGRSSPSSPAIL